METVFCDECKSCDLRLRYDDCVVTTARPLSTLAITLERRTQGYGPLLLELRLNKSRRGKSYLFGIFPLSCTREVIPNEWDQLVAPALKSSSTSKFSLCSLRRRHATAKQCACLFSYRWKSVPAAYTLFIVGGGGGGLHVGAVLVGEWGSLPLRRAGLRRLHATASCTYPLRLIKLLLLLL